MTKMALHYFLLMILFLFPVTGFSLSYDWKEGLLGVVTRCFETQEIKLNCEDLSDPEWKEEKIEELEIQATDIMGRKFFYSYEKGIPGDLCQEHYQRIKALLKTTKEACITGGVELTGLGDDFTSSKWRALETRKGRVVW